MTTTTATLPHAYPLPPAVALPFTAAEVAPFYAVPSAMEIEAYDAATYCREMRVRFGDEMPGEGMP